MPGEIHVGHRYWVHLQPAAPFRAEVEVTDLRRHGAVIRYTGRVEPTHDLPPYTNHAVDPPMQLSRGGDESWIGSAHWLVLEPVT